MADSLPPSTSRASGSPNAGPPGSEHSESRVGVGPADGSGPRRRGALRERARAGGQSQNEPKSTRPLLVSVGLHVVAGVVLLELITFGHGLSSFLRDKDKTEREERLTFVTPREQQPPETPTPKPTPRTATEPVNVRPPTTGPVLAPPTTEPVTAPVAARPDTGSGAPADGAKAVGALDPNLQGVKPGYTDVRVWRGTGGGGAASAGVASARNGAERLDSIIGFAITSAADSIADVMRAQGRGGGRKPGDWTRTDANGDKWGWDGMGIRLGKVMIPNALLGLLPLNAQKGMSGNMTAFDREKRIALAREDIMRNSERALGEAEFQKLNKELRTRREKERRDRLRAPDATVAPVKAVPDKSGTPQ